MEIKTYYDILTYLKEIIKDTEYEGHVFSVGGCERNKHLGLDTVKDIDLVIDLKHGGIDFAKWLEENGYTKGSVVVYENFGTAMFKLSEFPEEEIEVVHTRNEVYRDKNSRKPETGFGTIEEDCFRRDFTINSLYHNISTGEDLDLTGKGLSDLKNQFIKTCSSPDSIFFDDALRIMRAVRFSSQLSFKIDEDTLKSMKSNVERLKSISQERITDEFNKILLSNDPYQGLLYLDEIGFFDTICPYLYPVEELKLRAFAMIRDFATSERYKLETVLTILLINRYSEGYDLRNRFLKEFKYSNEIIKIVNLYSEESWHLELACALGLSDRVREIIHKCNNIEEFNDIVAVSKAARIIKSERKIYDLLNTIDVEEMIGYKLPVSGDDIMEILHIGPCANVGIMLNFLLQSAFMNPKITRDECIEIIKNLNYND